MSNGNAHKGRRSKGDLEDGDTVKMIFHKNVLEFFVNDEKAGNMEVNERDEDDEESGSGEQLWYPALTAYCERAHGQLADLELLCETQKL